MCPIDRRSWDLLGYYPVHQLVAGERTVERARPLPGSGRLWVRVTGAWGGDEVCLIDLRRWRLEHVDDVTGVGGLARVHHAQARG